MDCVFNDITNKKIAIVFNKCVNNPYKTLEDLEDTLIIKGIHPEVFEINEMKYGFDFVFAVGGDGTILHVSKFYSKTKTPVFGVNLGRLGFLSQVKADKIETAIDKILDCKFNIEKRMMLEFNNQLALNDFVIKGLSLSRTSRFVLKINNKFLCDYIADGIIISTPTGSTAYGLSAGGPVLYPMLDAVVIVPICPHTLTARPLVVPSDEKISISTGEDNFNFMISADGADIMEATSDIDIIKSKYQAHLALLTEDVFYSVLRAKLHWGVSPKNI